ncbi:MFS general substrate transporter [Annulohypoxylon maeteangense]|uniref:MFS general substrate transporter n=1 Tax=Annulohypoxylon maeteangense TaxID=1927788 RepID=UPI0020080EFF|nr:MFS general substrate transporter [Annulohypoxylon maeteangense]KAI0880542.1 MFS general substrate transporter [Annulohypoxylon maeteangense]
MGMWVLEDRYLDRPPGTSKLGEAQDVSLDSASTSELKKQGDIILVPQPSDSPNDPLNWSKTWKNAIMFTLAFSSGVTTSLGPMISPGLVIISQQYNIDPDTVATYMVGAILLFTGAITFFTASGANVWGKRPFFVISTLLLLISNVWGTFADSFPSLAAMRIFQGIASAPLETLVTSSVSDLYFVHERGLPLSIWGVMTATGVLLGQIISGFIIESMGISGAFAISALIFCLVLPLMYFVVLETSYTKPRTPGTTVDQRPDSRSSSIDIKRDLKGDLATEPKESYKSQLRLFRGRVSDESFWKGVFRPFPLILFPAVVFSTLVYGAFFCWLLMIGVLSVTIFSVPPYNLNPAQIGLTNIPLAIGALIFSPISGWMADALPVWMAKRNNGIFEPEFRLILMVIAIPLSTAGFIGFGLAASRGLSLTWCLVWITLHSIAVPFASQASISYVIDCHTKDANQAFVTINFIKAVLSFVASSIGNGLLAKYGAESLFTGIAIMNLTISLLTIPSYIYGKRMRSWMERSGWTSKF